jgi:uncharacterized caspase-like protein
VEARALPERRRALIVANADYADEALQGLASPAQDATALTRVLEDPDRCGFEVSAVVDADSAEVTEAVEGFLVDAERGDLCLLYFSCHGLKDENGRLYFATRNTRRNRLRSTAVPAAVVNDLLLGSRSRRKVLLLDCCYGGAFAKGMQVKADPAVHTGEQFGARGLVVLTASDSTQYAFDGDVVSGSATPSRFTAVLVNGLASGDADVDGDGFVTVDDAYEFVRRRLTDADVPQDPRKWEFDVAGRIVLGRTEAAAAELPMPVQVAAPPASRPHDGMHRLLQPTWWLSSVGVLAACVALTLLLVAWLDGPLTNWVKADYLPSVDDLPYRAAGLAAAWAVGYALVCPPASWRSPVPWDDPWRPLVGAYRDILRPNGARSFLLGLVSAVPINVLLVAAGSLLAAGLGYSWAGGSEGRDQIYQVAFVVLGLAGLALSFVPTRGR